MSKLPSDLSQTSESLSAALLLLASRGQVATAIYKNLCESVGKDVAPLLTAVSTEIASIRSSPDESASMRSVRRQRFESTFNELFTRFVVESRD